MSTTSSDSYIEPLRLKVIFKNLDDSITYYTFDSFESSNPINITSASIQLGLGQTGSFRISIADYAKTLDQTTFGLANKIYIYAGKTQQTYTPLMLGIGKTIDVKRKNTGLLDYDIVGSGIGIVFNETIINFKKNAFRQNLTSTTGSLLDVNHLVPNLARTLCTETNVFPIGNVPSIVNRYNLSTDGISDKITDFISTINEENVEASHAMGLMANAIGGYWGVDAEGKIFMEYANYKYSPIVIKDTVESTDLASRTSYFIGSWDYRMSIRREDGFYNRIYSRTSNETIENFIQANSNGFTKLYQKAVAQQWIPQADKFSNLGFLLRKVGDPRSTFNLLHGALVRDNGGFPTGTKLVTFTIPLSDIKSTPTAIFKISITTGGINVSVGEKYWIILYSRGFSPENTIEWFHDDFQRDTESIGMNSAFSDPDGQYFTEDLRWNVSNKGPVYAFATFDKLSHLTVAEDPFSIEKYGPVEIFMDVRGLDDNNTLDRYLHSILSYSSKPQMFYNINRVTIPDSLFVPGQLITIIDSMSGLTKPKNIKAEIQEVGYEFDAVDNALGATTCEIRPLGYYDYLTELQGFCE